MRKLFLILIFFVQSALAGIQGHGPLGVGLMIGSMTSVTGKYQTSSLEDYDFGIGFSGWDGTVLYGDYLRKIPGVLGSSTKFARETDFYLGAGPGAVFWSNTYYCGHWSCDRRTSSGGMGLFVRGLAGLDWHPEKVPLGVFLELGPTILLSPITGGSLDLGLGARYYF